MVTASRARRAGIHPSLAQSYDSIRSDWDFGKPSAYRRRRSGLPSMGSHGDYHYRSESHFLNGLELARDFIRNDCVVGQGIDRLADNVQPEKFQVEPKTGDTGVDAELFARFEEWGNDRRQCDIYAERTFGQMARSAFTQSIGDGDDLYIGLTSGELQGFEAHRIRTPQNAVAKNALGKPRRNIVLGVEKDVYGKNVRFWVTKEDVDPMAPFSRVGDATSFEAFDEEGDLQAFHVCRISSQRMSQTRGVSALAPVADVIDMGDDLRFLKMVQARLVSCVVMIRQKAENKFNLNGTQMSGGGPARDSQFGARTTDDDNRVFEELAPGAHITGEPGETISGFSPDVPNESFFQHSNLLLTFVAINLGLPLIVLLMDATATSFSGFRGAENMARRGFGRMQRDLIERFHSPVYRFKLKQFADEDPILREARERLGAKFYSHEWNAPGWTYIQPVEDVTGDQMEARSLMNSYRRIHARRGQVYEKVVIEQVEDCDTAITAAVKKFQQFRTKFPDVADVTWRDFLWLPTPDRISASIAVGSGSQPAASPSRQPQEANAE